MPVWMRRRSQVGDWVRRGETEKVVGSIIHRITFAFTRREAKNVVFWQRRETKCWRDVASERRRTVQTGIILVYNNWKQEESNGNDIKYVVSLLQRSK